MKRLFFLMLLIYALLPADASAVLDPEWRGLEGTTFQQWNFDGDDTLAAPEFINNDFGSATASISVGEMGAGWLDNPMLGTKTGVWDIGGEDGSITFDIDNRPSESGYKEIYVQVLYYQAISDAPVVSIPLAQFISSQTVLVESDISIWGWYLQRSIWRIEISPQHEQIVLTGTPNMGSVIDQVTIDTYSVPEPASIVLAVIGGLAVLKNRKKKL